MKTIMMDDVMIRRSRGHDPKVRRTCQVS